MGSYVSRRLFMYRRLSKPEQILTKKVRNNRIKLNKCFNEIVNEFSIDYSNEEFQDIQSAVLEYLNRLTAKVNERGLFKVARIQPCGSMAERTSMWKTDIHGMPSTEFDFLAVLKVPDACKFSPVDFCGADCMRISGCQLLNDDLTHLLGYETYNQHRRENYSRVTDEYFKRELLLAVDAFCDCFSVKQNVKDVRCTEYFSSQTVTGCKNCTVSRPTGQLQILLPTRRAGCSLRLTWTSSAKSLLAPVSKETIAKKMQRLQHLQIDVDFLPALELFQDDPESEHKCLLVSKSCPERKCGGWRISQCLAEIDHFRAKISREHKKCYKVLKYLLDHHRFLIDYKELKSYSIKTAVLNHSITCCDSVHSCADCVFTILRELEDAIKSRLLIVFHGKVNLFKKEFYAKPSEKCISYLLNLLSRFESREVLELEYGKQTSKVQTRFLRKLLTFKH